MSYQRKFLLKVGKFYLFLFNDAHYRITRTLQSPPEKTELKRETDRDRETEAETQREEIHYYKIEHNPL